MQLTWCNHQIGPYRRCTSMERVTQRLTPQLKLSIADQFMKCSFATIGQKNPTTIKQVVKVEKVRYGFIRVTYIPNKAALSY